MDAVWTFLESLKTFFADKVVAVVKAMGWMDGIDIFILAVLLFLVYRFIRDRRAGKLLMGLVSILLLSFLSDIFHMHALHYILSDFRQIGWLAVLILFQPELRSALEKVGGTSMMGLKGIASDSSRELATHSSGIDAICTAASDMARDKVGALIVIERSTKLGEYINSGVLVDAAISPYILRNIFFNKAPLHDGAVIIRNQRIYAAGCFLPLSTKEDINKDLGTRHRAAIGLSEISDALVIVVSEETGNISVAMDGNLERNFNYNTLKQKLNSVLEPGMESDEEKKKEHSSGE